jgi:hypothetical protein
VTDPPFRLDEEARSFVSVSVWSMHEPSRIL